MRLRWKPGSIVFAGLAILAGGCDSSSPSPAPTPTPAPVNTPPRITSTAPATVAENGSLAYRLIVADPDFTVLTYSLAGADAAQFKITAEGLLDFQTPPNFEAPADDNRDNVYNVQVTVSDGQATASQTIAITVENNSEGIRVHRIATGISQVIGFSSDRIRQEFYLMQRDGTVLIGKNGVGDFSKNLAIKGWLTDLAPNGIISATGINPISLAYSGLRVLYIDTSKRLMFRDFFVDYPIITSCPIVMLPHVDRPSEITGGIFGNYIAVGATQSGLSPDLAQDPTSNIGKMFRIIEGAVYSSPCQDFRITMIAMGLHDVRGADERLILDHGTGVAEEINLTPTGNGVANFGWPFREGTRTLAGTPPAGLVDPVSSYAAGGPGAIGSSIVPGGFYFWQPSLDRKYLFADSDSGAIYTLPMDCFNSGQVIFASSYENRTLDFKPDAGSLAHPVLIAINVGDNKFYMLDRDGDLFVVNSE